MVSVCLSGAPGPGSWARAGMTSSEGCSGKGSLEPGASPPLLPTCHSGMLAPPGTLQCCPMHAHLTPQGAATHPGTHPGTCTGRACGSTGPQHADRTRALEHMPIVPTDGHSGLSLCCRARAPCGGTGPGMGEGPGAWVPSARPSLGLRLPPSRTEMLQPPRAPGVRQAGCTRSPTLPVSPTQSMAQGSFQPRSGPWGFTLLAHPGGDPVC